MTAVSELSHRAALQGASGPTLSAMSGVSAQSPVWAAPNVLLLQSGTRMRHLTEDISRVMVGSLHEGEDAILAALHQAPLRSHMSSS